MPTAVQALGNFGGLANPAVGSIRGNQNLLNEAQTAGMFSPYGSPRLRALRRRYALQRFQNQLGGASTYGRLAGLDPMAQRAALTRANIGANAGLASELNQSDFAEQSANQDFLRSLYQGQLSYEQQRQLQREAAKQQSQGGVGSAIGGVVGKIGGRLIDKFIPI